MKAAGPFTTLSLTGTPGAIHDYVPTFTPSAGFIGIKDGSIAAPYATGFVDRAYASGTLAAPYATGSIEGEV